MDLGGMAGMERLVGSSSEGGGGHFSSPMVSSGHETLRQMGLFGSGFLKQGRSSGPEEPDWRCQKMARTETMTLNSTKASRSNCHSLFPEGQQMLSFSSAKPNASVLRNDGTLPYYLTSSSVSPSSASYFRNAGMVPGSYGFVTGIRGPFTPSQWMELEHQVLIYKYIDANVPIPSNLLIPFRRSLIPSGFSGYSAGSLRPTALGWGAFHLGFSGNTDPEPGRCRRTDGKKWRCSRDAVADQKYCERHMNRGRHRSRKPVEGQTGHAPKVIPAVTPSQSASAVASGGSSNSHSIAQQKASQPVSTDLPPNQFNRILLNKKNINDRLQGPDSLSMATSINPSKPKETLFSIPKQNKQFEDSSSGAEFGLISSDSLLNPPRSFLSSTNHSDQEPQHHPLRHFFDDWPKNRSDQSPINWEVGEIHSDRTQLSISIPMESSDFSSSSSSPTQGRLALSPNKFAREFDPFHMGLGLGGTLNEVNRKQASWIPVSWETSMGGPLGEVLKNTNNLPREYSENSSASALNLMSERGDSSPPMGLSPTGVLQKAAFASVSSSTGSSPRTENPRAQDRTSSLCDDIFG